MKKITYPAFYRFPARYTFALLTLAGSGSVAMADGKISMDAFSLAPGQTVTVAVNLDQTGDIYGLQANVALPNGLKLVEAKADKERVEDKIHTFQYKKNGDSYIFLITPDKSYPIYGNSGMLFELTLQAEDNFFGGDIQFSNVVLSNTSAEKTVQDDFSVNVSLTDFTVGDFSVAADLLTITENGGPYMVELSLDNKIPVKGLQGTISLPEGLSIKKDSKGYPIFINGERLTESASLDYNEKNGRFVLIDQTSTDFWGYGGVLFSFEVVPDESKLAKTSEIALGSFTISTANNASVDFNQELVVTVDNSAYFKAGFEKFLTDIEAVRQDCQDAMETLQNHYKDVAADYLPQLEELLANLDEEKNRIGQEQEAGKSPSEVALNLEPYTESITKILADAKAAQSDIIYTAYEAKVKELTQSFEDTKAYISTYLPDVAAQFEEQLAGIAQNIESFSTIMAEAKAAGKPAMELQFGTDEFVAVDEMLEALLTEAKTAQSDFTYAAYEAKVAELKQSFEDTKAYISTYLPDVAAQFEEQLAGIAQNIESFSTIMAEAKAAGKPAMELQFGTEEFAAVDEMLEALLTEAKAAQSDFTYAAYEEKVKELTQSFEDTKAYISTYLPDVAAQFEEQLAGIAQNIESFSTIMAEAKAAGKPAMELQFGTDEFAAVDEQLAALLDDAKAAQSNFTYAAYEAKVAELKQSFEDTKAYISTYLPDVAAQFEEQLAGIAQNIESFSTIMAEAKAAGKPAMELQFGTEEFAAVDEMLEALLTEAKAAQSDFTYAAYEEKVKELTQSFEDTKAYISTYLPDVAAQFEEQLAGIAQNIESFSTIMAEAKAAGKPAMELQFGTDEFAAVDEQLAALLDEAKTAQSDFIYANYETTLKELAAAYTVAEQELQENYADVAADFEERMAAVAENIAILNDALAEAKQQHVPGMDLQFGAAEFKMVADEIAAILKDAQDKQNLLSYDGMEQLILKLQKSCAEAIDYVKTQCPDADRVYAARLDNYKHEIMDWAGIFATGKAHNTPIDELGFNQQVYDELKAKIQTALDDAKNAQSEYLYGTFETKLAELSANCADTKAYIETFLPNVAGQYAATMEKAAQDIKNFENTIKNFKAAGKLALDLTFGMADLEAVDQQMKDVLEEAKSAESAYLYTEFDKALAQLATDLADTKEALNNYPDVKAGFAGRMADVEATLAEVKAFIEESKAAGTSAMELTSAKEALQAMDAELANILAEAKAAQSEYLYAEFDKALAQLATDLADTKEALNNYPDVKDNFAERMAAVEAALAEVKAFIEESKAAGADASDLTSAKEALQAMDAELASILAEAKAAQSDFAYAEFDKALAQLATALADTKEALDNCPDVKGLFAERMAAVEAALAEVQAFIEESKAAGADATDLTSAKEAIQAMDAELASILAEAKAAQSDFAYAEFDKALAQLATALADTKEALDNCPDVKGLFAERMAAVEAALAEVQAFIEESKAAGADATDLTSAKEALQAMEAELAAIQAEAKAAQEEYTALYADYTAQVDEVQAALEEAVKYIENECADVADNYKNRAEEIQAMIDAVKADVEAAKTSGNLFDFVFSVADIKVAIDEMLQAAIDEQQTVGIGLIELDGEQPVRIYSTSGVQSDKVIKGKVNIVRMPDGTVKKIFVK